MGLNLNMEAVRFGVACNAPFGRGGLGRHLKQVVESQRQRGPVTYFCSYPEEGDPLGVVVRSPWFDRLRKFPPYRFSSGMRSFLSVDTFDSAMAGVLTQVPVGDDSHFTGFAGMAKRSFLAARSHGYSKLQLESPTSHVHNIIEKHAAALKRNPLEVGWLHKWQVAKSLEEYQMADTIVVTSEYMRRSMLKYGISESKMRRRNLLVDDRFVPPAERTPDDKFRIVYVGSLTVVKGIPILMEAFTNLGIQNAELTLVGGWQSRGMRKYLEEYMARDSRIRVMPGDPLPHLHAADVYVHPSWDDGFAYAAVEALACGTPTLVTPDTGMCEYVTEGVNGYIFETGKVDELVDQLRHVRSHPLAGTSSLLPLGGRTCTFDS